MPNRKKPKRAPSSNAAYPDREIMAKAEGRFAKADKQRASFKADGKKAVEREQERVQHIKRAKAPKGAR